MIERSFYILGFSFFLTSLIALSEPAEEINKSCSPISSGSHMNEECDESMQNETTETITPSKKNAYFELNLRRKLTTTANVEMPDDI